MDAVFLFRPEDKDSQGHYEAFFKATDMAEKNILTDITALAMELDLERFVFPQKKELKEKFMTHVFELTQNLFNANHHKRNYKIKSNEEIKKFRKACVKDPNKHLDIYQNPTELWIEINGCLTNIKSALDSLAACINPLLGTNIHGWHKGTDPSDGKEKSGYDIIKILNRNIPKEKQPSVQPIIKIINQEINWITYLVQLRDLPVHQGGLKNVSKLKYEQKSRKVVGQIITHHTGGQEEVEIFLKRAVETITNFASRILLASIHTRVKGVVAAKIVENNGNARWTWVPEQSTRLSSLLR